MDNYFEILGVNENSSDKEVKERYRELVKKYHPDANRDNEEFANEMTAKINAAYSALSTEEGRKQYSYILSNRNSLNTKTRQYPAYFVLSEYDSFAEIRGEVYFDDGAVALFYEILSGINLQLFFLQYPSGSALDFNEFWEIYSSDSAVKNREKSVGFINNPDSAGDQNTVLIFKYLRRRLTNTARFYTPRKFDRILRHIMWCEYEFLKQFEEQTGKSLLEIEGIQKAEYTTYEFNFDTGPKNKLYYLLIKIAAAIVIITVLAILAFFGLFIVGAVVIVIAVFALIGFIYKLFNRN